MNRASHDMRDEVILDKWRATPRAEIPRERGRDGSCSVKHPSAAVPPPPGGAVPSPLGFLRGGWRISL